MKIQKFGGDKPRKRMQVVDNRVPGEGVEVRTVIYIEVGNMPRGDISALVKQVSSAYENTDKATHYLVPVRGGKIGTDVLFEQEWLNVVRETCTTDPSGNIVLKDGAKEVLVRREYV